MKGNKERRDTVKIHKLQTVTGVTSRSTTAIDPAEGMAGLRVLLVLALTIAMAFQVKCDIK